MRKALRIPVDFSNSSRSESTEDEVTLLKRFYNELLFDKLRLATSDFFNIGQDQVLLLSAMTKTAGSTK